MSLICFFAISFQEILRNQIQHHSLQPTLYYKLLHKYRCWLVLTASL